MTYINWNDFKVVLPRDRDEWERECHHFAFCIENVVIWVDTFITPYSEILLGDSPVFEGVFVDVDGTNTEAVKISSSGGEVTVVCPEPITALFLSDPQVIERWIESDKDGPYVGPGWNFDPNKAGFSRFYKEESDMDNKKYVVWGNGEKEYLSE
jgi:hypothetical protein